MDIFGRPPGQARSAERHAENDRRRAEKDRQRAALQATQAAANAEYLRQLQADRAARTAARDVRRADRAKAKSLKRANRPRHHDNASARARAQRGF